MCFKHLIPYSSFLGVSSFICFIVYFLSRLVFCFIVDLPADSFFIAKADFFECGGEEGGGACVSCSVLIVITPAQNLEFLIL